MRWLVVLHTMWGHGTSGKPAPRFFNINPGNCSGRVLYKLFEGIPFVVTNAAGLMSGSAAEYQPVDKQWLADNIARHPWKGVLVCGNEARDTFQGIKVDCPLIYMPHPASRSFRLTHRQSVRDDIFTSLAGIRSHEWDKVTKSVKIIHLSA